MLPLQSAAARAYRRWGLPPIRPLTGPGTGGRGEGLAEPGQQLIEVLVQGDRVAAQHGRRRDVLRELGQALTRTGDYRGSTEELTPG